jgi:uncharacterized protein (TIRG00374 family)
MAGQDPAPRRATWLFLAKAAVSLLLLGLLFWRIDRASFLQSLRTLSPALFVGCAGLYFLGYVLSTVRWRGLLAAEGLQLSLTRLTLVYFQGSFFNLFLPTLIGGDIVRGVSMYRLTGGHPASLASILVDRLTGFAALIGIAVAAVALAQAVVPDPQVAGMVLGVAAAFVLLVVVLMNTRLMGGVTGLLRLAGLGRFEAKLEGLVDAVHRYRAHRRALAVACAYSVILQALIIVTYYLVGRGLGLSVPLRYFFVFVPLITVVAMLPVSVAGLGVREGSVVYFFGRLGVDPATALSMSLIWFALSVIVSALGGFAFLMDTRATKRTGD